MANTVAINIIANTRQATSGINTVQSRLGKLGGIGRAVGRTVATGLAVGAAGLLAFGATAVKSASEAEQSLGATQTVFGKYADTVTKDSNRAALAYGLSANEYRENANLIGSLFANQGVSTDKLAGQTKTMIGRASDLAATFGGPTSDAVSALGSAFKGEFDPLEKYGISLKQSTVNAEAASIAQRKYGKDILDLSTAQQTAIKRQATQNLIMEQSRKSTGAFARESNTLAGQQQRLSAQFANITAKVGTALTPALTKLAKSVSTNVMPQMQKLANEYAPKVASAIEGLANKIPGIVAKFKSFKGFNFSSGNGAELKEIGGNLQKIGPALAEAAKSLPSFNDLLKVSNVVIGFAADNIGLLTKALPYLAAGYIAVKASQIAANAAALISVPVKIAEVAVNRQLVASNRALVASRASSAATAVADTAATTADTAATAANTAATSAGTTATAANTTAENTGILARIRATAALVASKVAMVATAAATRAYAAAQWLLNAAMSANPLGLIVIAIVALVAVLVLAWKKSETFRNIVTGAWNAIKASAVAVFNFLKPYIMAVWNFIKEKVVTNVKIALAVVKAVWNGIKTAVTTAVNVVKNTVSTQFKAVSTTVKTVWNAIKSATSAVWNAIRSVVTSVVRGVVSNIKSQFNTAKSVVTGAWNAVKSATTSAWNGIKNAVTSAVDKVISTVKGIKDKVMAGLAGIASWLYSAGTDLIQGMINGVKNAAGNLVSTAKDVVGDAIDAAKGLLGINSPSRVFAEIGRQTMAGLVKGFKEGRSGVVDQIGDTIERVEKKMNQLGFGEKVIASKMRYVKRYLRANSSALKQYAQNVKRANAQVEKAADKLKDLQKTANDYAASIADNARDYGSITNLNSAFNTDAMAQQLRDRIAKIRQFNETMQQLIASGLNKNMVRQLMEAGVEGGLAYAEAIASGGPGAVAELNDLQKQLNDASKGLGSTARKDAYKNGLDAARDTLRGMESNKRDAERAARKFAQRITRELRRVFFRGRTNPMRRVGQQMAEAINQGMRDGGAYTGRSTRRAQPRMSSRTATQRNEYKITVNVPMTADYAAVGREVKRALEAHENQGGRTRV